mmetsp:Transcript_47321/g.84652  ORF Transcript_47321/g.84652 Transcript_47321/m.84652 type:complete len:98 (-) Transcript_47321:172-465(-)
MIRSHRDTILKRPELSAKGRANGGTGCQHSQPCKPDDFLLVDTNRKRLLLALCPEHRPSGDPADRRVLSGGWLAGWLDAALTSTSLALERGGLPGDL